MKTYVTFGQSHIHKINGKIFDCDCVAIVRGDTPYDCRQRTEELFGTKFSFTHDDTPDMSYYPRGLIEVE